MRLSPPHPRRRVAKPGLQRERWWVIPATLVLAVFLTTIPHPEWIKYARPDWVTLVLFYWCLAVPRWIGVGYGWLLGLLLDILQFTLFGQHAIGKALVAIVAVSFYRRLRLYHLWQQCLVIMVVTALDIGIVVWVHRLASGIEIRVEYWLAALTTTLLWPMVYLTLRKLRHRSRLVRQ